MFLSQHENVFYMETCLLLLEISFAIHMTLPSILKIKEQIFTKANLMCILIFIFQLKDHGA